MAGKYDRVEEETQNSLALLRFRGIFAYDPAFWRVTCVVVGAVAVGKGLHLPSRWTASSAQVDYRFGFIKRGLFGALFDKAFGLEHYRHFALFSFAILFLMLGLLAVYTAKSKIGRRLLRYEVVALFFSSYAITYITHLVGYFDLLLSCVTIALLLIRNPWVRVAAEIPLTVAALMTHEIFLLLFVPILVLSFLLQGGVGPGQYGARAMAVSGLLLGMIALGVTWRLAARRPRTADEVTVMQSTTQARTDFVVRGDYFAVMRLSAEDNSNLMKAFHREKRWWMTNGACVVLFGPTVVLLLLTVRHVLLSSGAPNSFFGIALAAALSPLLLHLLAWDAVRWNAWVVVDSYLVLLTVCRSIPGPRVGSSMAFRNAIFLVMLLNMATGGFLMDKQRVSSYPFFPEMASDLRGMLPWHWSPPPN